MSTKRVSKAKKSSKISVRAQKRFADGFDRTNKFIRALAAAWDRKVPSTDFSPDFFEPAIKNKGYCQLHAINNAIGSGLVTPRVMEELRKEFVQEVKKWSLKDSRVGSEVGHASGFWNEDFFFSRMKKHFRIQYERARIGADGTHKNFLELLAEKFPNWKDLNFVMYITYETKQRLEDHVLKQVRHAVAMRCGHVIDADYPKFFPLAEYPLLTKITKLYIVTKMPEAAK